MLVFIFLLGSVNMNCSNGKANNTADAKSKKPDKTSQTDSTSKASPDKNKPEQELIPVETTVISSGTISDYLLQSSNLETEEMADVYSRVQGLVERIYVEEGDYVKKGQLLLTLEADEFQLAEKKAAVNFQQKKSAFERVDAMYQKNLVSREDWEQAKFNREAAKIEWDEAKLNLDYTKIKAPIAGYIAERLCRPGDRIQPTVKLFSVINTDEMIAVVHVPEKEMGTIKKNQPAFIRSIHLKDQQFPGWIKRVSPAVDPQSGTFKVTVGVRNRNNILKPGMFVNVNIVTSTHTDAVLIPKTAIVYENERMNVFVVRDSVAHKIPLTVGFQDYEKVESLEGVAAGDEVIVVGQAGLKDKTRVKVVRQRTNS